MDSINFTGDKLIILCLLRNIHRFILALAKLQFPLNSSAVAWVLSELLGCYRVALLVPLFFISSCALPMAQQDQGNQNFEQDLGPSGQPVDQKSEFGAKEEYRTTSQDLYQDVEVQGHQNQEAEEWIESSSDESLPLNNALNKAWSSVTSKDLCEWVRDQVTAGLHHHYLYASASDGALVGREAWAQDESLSDRMITSWFEALDPHEWIFVEPGDRYLYAKNYGPGLVEEFRDPKGGCEHLWAMERLAIKRLPESRQRMFRLLSEGVEMGWRYDLDTPEAGAEGPAAMIAPGDDPGGRLRSLLQASGHNVWDASFKRHLQHFAADKKSLDPSISEDEVALLWRQYYSGSPLLASNISERVWVVQTFLEGFFHSLDGVTLYGAEASWPWPDLPSSSAYLLADARWTGSKALWVLRKTGLEVPSWDQPACHSSSYCDSHGIKSIGFDEHDELQPVPLFSAQKLGGWLGSQEAALNWPRRRMVLERDAPAKPWIRLRSEVRGEVPVEKKRMRGYVLVLEDQSQQTKRSVGVIKISSMRSLEPGEEPLSTQLGWWVHDLTRQAGGEENSDAPADDLQGRSHIDTWVIDVQEIEEGGSVDVAMDLLYALESPEGEVGFLQTIRGMEPMFLEGQRPPAFSGNYVVLASADSHGPVEWLVRNVQIFGAVPILNTHTTTAGKSWMWGDGSHSGEGARGRFLSLSTSPTLRGDTQMSRAVFPYGAVIPADGSSLSCRGVVSDVLLSHKSHQNSPSISATSTDNTQSSMPDHLSQSSWGQFCRRQFHNLGDRADREGSLVESSEDVRLSQMPANWRDELNKLAQRRLTHSTGLGSEVITRVEGVQVEHYRQAAHVALDYTYLKNHKRPGRYVLMEMIEGDGGKGDGGKGDGGKKVPSSLVSSSDRSSHRPSPPADEVLAESAVGDNFLSLFDVSPIEGAQFQLALVEVSSSRDEASKSKESEGLGSEAADDGYYDYKVMICRSGSLDIGTGSGSEGQGQAEAQIKKGSCVEAFIGENREPFRIPGSWLYDYSYDQAREDQNSMLSHYNIASEERRLFLKSLGMGMIGGGISGGSTVNPRIIGGVAGATVLDSSMDAVAGVPGKVDQEVGVPKVMITTILGTFLGTGSAITISYGVEQGRKAMVSWAKHSTTLSSGKPIFSSGRRAMVSWTKRSTRPVVQFAARRIAPLLRPLLATTLVLLGVKTAFLSDAERVIQQPWHPFSWVNQIIWGSQSHDLASSWVAFTKEEASLQLSAQEAYLSLAVLERFLQHHRGLEAGAIRAYCLTEDQCESSGSFQREIGRGFDL